MKINFKNFILFFIILIIEIVIALYIKDKFIRPYIGDILVILLLYLFICSFFQNIKWLHLYIFIFAVIIEIFQYLNIIHLIGLENNTFAKIIIGSTFDIKDIICYFIGFLIIHILIRIKNISK